MCCVFSEAPSLWEGKDHQCVVCPQKHRRYGKARTTSVLCILRSTVVMGRQGPPVCCVSSEAPSLWEGKDHQCVVCPQKHRRYGKARTTSVLCVLRSTIVMGRQGPPVCCVFSEAPSLWEGEHWCYLCHESSLDLLPVLCMLELPAHHG